MVCLEHVGGLEKTEQDDSQSGLVDELGWSDSPFRSTVRSAHTHTNTSTLWKLTVDIWSHGVLL